MGVPLTKDTVSDINKAVKDVLSMSHVTKQEQGRRLSVCQTCEHKRGTRCNLCGCFINYKSKLKSSECPLGKWSTALSETTIDSPSEESGTEQESH